MESYKELINDLQKLCSEIDLIINDRFDDILRLTQSAKSTSVIQASMFEKLHGLLSQNGGFISCTNGICYCIKEYALKTHDIEVFIFLETLEKLLSIDLDSLVPTEQINLGAFTATVSQSNKATLQMTPIDQCHPVGLDEFALVVPLEIKAAGHVYHPRIGINNMVRAYPTDESDFFIYPSTGIIICPEDELPVLAKVKIREMCLSKSQKCRPIPLMPINLGSGKVRLYAASGSVLQDPKKSGLQFFGVSKTRHRSPFPFIDPSGAPDWANAILKLHPEILISQITAVLSKYGATLRAPVQFLPNDTLEFFATIENEAMTEVCRTKVGAYGRADFTIRATLSTNGKNLIQFSVTKHGEPEISIDFKPDIIIDWLAEQLFRTIAESLAKIFFAFGDISSPREFYLERTRKIELHLTENSLVLYLIIY